MFASRLRTHGLLVALLLITITGCQEDVTAITGTPGRDYTLFGVLRPRADTQYVLVSSIDGRLRPVPDEPLAARVTSTDLETGAERVWRDSLVANERGQLGHVFWSPFRAAYGHRYRLAVEGDGGAGSSAEVTVSPDAELVPQTPERAGSGMKQSVKVTGAAPRLTKIRVTYEVQYGCPRTGWVPITYITIPYDAYEGRRHRTEEGWVLDVALTQDYTTLRDTLQRRDETLTEEGLLRPVFYEEQFGIAINRITLDLIAANKAWMPPNYEFDLDVLQKPGTMSNVEKGQGFLGAGFRLSKNWMPLEIYLHSAGYTTSYADPSPCAQPF